MTIYLKQTDNGSCFMNCVFPLISLHFIPTALTRIKLIGAAISYSKQNQENFVYKRKYCLLLHERSGRHLRKSKEAVLPIFIMTVPKKVEPQCVMNISRYGERTCRISPRWRLCRDVVLCGRHPVIQNVDAQLHVCNSDHTAFIKGIENTRINFL